MSLAKISELNVSCPYCHIGGAVVKVTAYDDGSSKVEGVKDPRKCSLCDRFFRIVIKNHLEGVALPPNYAGRGHSNPVKRLIESLL